MPRRADSKGVYRIIDANINRAKEGLRVCEEVLRFIVCDRVLTARFKDLRHRLDRIIGDLRADPRLLDGRESRLDVGRRIPNQDELRREGWREVFYANLQRVKESVRVLEEFSKLDNTRRALSLKETRYIVYELEKKALRAFDKLHTKV